MSLPIELEIIEYLRDHVIQDASVQLTPQTPLLQTRLVTSLNMVALLAFVEDRFGVEVPDDAIRAEHFESPTSLAGLVRSLQQA